MYRGPRLTDPYFNVEDTASPLKTVRAGLLPLQVAVDKAYMETYFPNISNEWLLTSFPYPPYYELPEEIRFALSHRFHLLYVQFFLMMGITFMAMVFASSIIHDKSSGIREWLCLYGAPRLMVNLSWLISFCFEAIILAILEVFLLKSPTLNGPTIKYMSTFVLLFVLLLYYYMTFCWVYLLATFLNNRVICILIIAACWFVTPLLQWIPPDQFALQGALAILPNAGMAMIFMSFQEFDGAETMLEVSNMHEFPIHYLPVGVLLLIMLGSSVLLVLLGMYVDLVKPGKYGRAKPWYLFSRKEKVQDIGGGGASQNDGRFFEQISHKDPIALECVGIFKFFNKHKALNNINMKILKNKITILLGHNGAGKTTLLSILCGLYSPTKGHLYTEEYDVFQGDNIKKFRKVMGYCPQYNWFIEELTIKQHFIIFGLLKGLSLNEAKERCNSWTERFNMTAFLNTRASKLSGGTKRKLCLAIAMTGGPQYLFLDEPSSSLDAESTRTFWDVLLLEKDNYTVIMTTHDMDEANLLGDRIAFMVAGQLRGYGSSLFLKQQLKIGHKLACSTNEKDTVKVVQKVRNIDHSISMLHQTNHTVTFGFPVGKSAGIPSLMRSLKSEFGDGITLALSHASIDEVFVGVHSEITSGKTSVGSQELPVDYLELLRTPDNESSPWSCGRVMGIFKKKIQWTSNHKTSVLALLVMLPILGTVLTVYFINQTINGGSSVHSRDLKLTMDKYRGTRAFISRRDGNWERISGALKLAMNDSGITYEEVDENMVDHLNAQSKKNLFEYRSKYVFAFASENKVSGRSTAFYSRNAFHSAPIAYSALMNALLFGNASIISRNNPVVGKEGSSCSPLNPILVSILSVIILGPVLLISSSYFIFFPHVERTTYFKHLQLMTGLQPTLYWAYHLMFDVILFSITVLVIIAILTIMDSALFWRDYMVITSLIIVLLLYSISTITLAYAWSFCGCSIATIVIVFVCIHALLIIGYFVVSVIVIPIYSEFPKFDYLYFLPWMIMIRSLQKIMRRADESRACAQCGDVGSCLNSVGNPLIPSLYKEFLTFVIVSLVYFAFILAMDHGFGRKIKPIFERMLYRKMRENEDEIDHDVKQERLKVEVLRTEREEYQPELLCDGLKKKYSFKTTAVHDVTFAAERGEIFGLLGANGAGKSTTFGILSGLISPAQGSATVSGKWELTDCEYWYIKNIGYCPQFHGYLPGLTGRCILRLFGCLHGFKPPLLDLRVNMWLQALDMESIADVPCENYSGGNQRKLSFAIAMIGCPPVVLLDEPTVSIDPVVRTRIWDILMTSMRNRNQAIILTSHTITECETICDRLTIMVDGQMKCLGSVPKLKNRFGKSCILRVKTRYNTTMEQAHAVQSAILEKSKFSRYAQLIDEQPNILNINVTTENIKTYDVFAEMQKIKEQNSAVEDFSLVDTPLEEVFIKMAQENRSNVPSEKKRRRNERARRT